MALPRGIAELLRASVARPGVAGTPAEVLARVRAEDLDGLARGAALHGIGGYVCEAVRDSPVVPDGERERLKLLRDRAAMIHLRSVADLRHLDEVLGGAGIPWLVMKGPTLSERIHGRAELRTYSDLDVLVDPGRLGDAMQALEDAGATMLDRNWTLIRETGKGEVHLQLATGTALDLHWHFLNSRQRRRQFPIDPAKLFERTRPVEVGGVRVATLGASDTVVYVALHALLSGADRLVWLKDIERLLATEDLVADEIAATAAAWRADLVFAAMLQRTATTIGLPPQADALAPTKRGRVWGGFTRVVWGVTHPEREDGSGSFARLVARSTRHSAAASVREVVRRGALHGLHRLRGQSGDADDAQRATADPLSAACPSGGAGTRRAFVADVQAEAAVLGQRQSVQER